MKLHPLIASISFRKPSNAMGLNDTVSGLTRDDGVSGQFIVMWIIFYLIIIVFLYCCFGRNFFSWTSRNEPEAEVSPTELPADQHNRPEAETRSADRIFFVSCENDADCDDQAPPYKIEDLPPSYEDAVRRLKELSDTCEETGNLNENRIESV